MESNTPTSKPDSRKTAYGKPEFRKYGNLARITATVGKNGSNDGGKGNNAKTGV